MKWCVYDCVCLCARVSLGECFVQDASYLHAKKRENVELAPLACTKNLHQWIEFLFVYECGLI